MADSDIGRSSEGGVAAFLSDAPAEATMARPSSYCGECGSWGAHGARCLSCGYDFYADPIEVISRD